MKHKVLKSFIDKESGELFTLGSFYISDDFNRVVELENLGFVQRNEELQPPKQEKPKKKTSSRKKAADEHVGEG